MSIVEEYKLKYETGFSIFEKLFNLKKDDFIQVMKNVFKDDSKVLKLLENKPSVIKILENDIPEKIELHSFYSSILIDYSGVRYKPVHGCLLPILKFDKFFNIDVALNGR